MEAIFPQNSPQNRILETSIRHKNSKKSPTFSLKIPERVDIETIKWHTPVRKYHEPPPECNHSLICSQEFYKVQSARKSTRTPKLGLWARFGSGVSASFIPTAVPCQIRSIVFRRKTMECIWFGMAVDIWNMLKAWFLSQLRPRQRRISSRNKAISVKDDWWLLNLIIALFLCRGRGVCRVLETLLKRSVTLTGRIKRVCTCHFWKELT